MIASLDYTDISAFSPQDLGSEIWKEMATETSGWLRMKSAQKGSLCHGDCVFPLLISLTAPFIPARILDICPGRIRSLSHACTCAAHSKPCLLTLQATANQIYLFGLRGKRLDCWFAHHECSCLREENKITENQRGEKQEMVRVMELRWLKFQVFFLRFKLVSSHIAASELGPWQLPRVDHLVRTARFAGQGIGRILIWLLLAFIWGLGYSKNSLSQCKVS